MKHFKIKLSLTLTILGLLGVASMLLSDISLSAIPEEIRKSISPEKLKLVMLINPAIMVVTFTVIGTLIYDKVNYRVPLLEDVLGKPARENYSAKNIIIYGCVLGIIAGFLILVITGMLKPYLPRSLTDTSSDTNLNIITKLLYGGIVEELLMRFGLMSLVTWILFKITKKLSATIYWIAICIAALLFAAGHLPVVFQKVSNPDKFVYAYIIAGNSIGGILFGYAYWQKGLESAMLAHAFAHVTMISFTFVSQ